MVTGVVIFRQKDETYIASNFSESSFGSVMSACTDDIAKHITQHIATCYVCITAKYPGRQTVVVAFN